MTAIGPLVYYLCNNAKQICKKPKAENSFLA